MVNDGDGYYEIEGGSGVGEEEGVGDDGCVGGVLLLG